MTEEEKNAMIQFFGTIHAQAKKTDQMVVGQSNHLRPISNDIQNQLQHVLHAPAKSEPVYQNIPVLQNNIPLQPPQRVEKVEPQIEASAHLQSSNLIETLVEINKTLNKIVLTIEQFCNGKKSSKGTK